MKAKQSDHEELAYLISHHFSKSDHYATVEGMALAETLVIRDGGQIVAYLMYEEESTAFVGVRSGVRRSHRGQGLGLKLYRTMVRKAKRAGKTYKTYCSLSNVTSLNAHVRAGMRVERISDFVYLST